VIPCAEAESGVAEMSKRFREERGELTRQLLTFDKVHRLGFSPLARPAFDG
jgi:hypothetical protein